MIKYPVTTLGPGKRIGIWTQGCGRQCKGCMSRHSWEYDPQAERSVEWIIDVVRYYSEKYEVDGITISGGEPFDQADLTHLLSALAHYGHGDVLLYTGYYIDELKAYTEALENVSVLIDGPYVDELNDNMPLRGSSNQNVYVLKQEYAERYMEYLQKPRCFDVDVENGIMTVIGLLPASEGNG